MPSEVAPRYFRQYTLLKNLQAESSVKACFHIAEAKGFSVNIV